MQGQCLGVVEQNLSRHAAEGAEGALQSVEPTVLPRVSKRPHMQPARIAEGRDEEEDLDRNTADLHPAFTEVDCNCSPGWVLNRRVARVAATSSWRNGAVARSTVRRLTIRPFSDASFWRTTSALPPCDETVRRSSRIIRPASSSATQTHRRDNRPRPANGAPCCARTRVPPRCAWNPAQRLQPQHRRHLVQRLHHIPPLIVRQRKNRLTCCHSNLFQMLKGGQSLMSSGSQFAVAPDNRPRLSGA